MHDRAGSAPTKRHRPDPNANPVKILDTAHESEALVVNGLSESVGIDSQLTSIEAFQDTLPGDAIAKRAYEKFMARGCAHGLDREDWAAAELELNAEALSTRGSARTSRKRKELDGSNGGERQMANGK